MTLEQRAVWLAAGERTPFASVDGAFTNRDAVALSVPVVQAMASRVKGPVDFAVWGWVAQTLNYANLAREIVGPNADISRCGPSLAQQIYGTRRRERQVTPP